MQALIATGYTVYAINPMQVSRYRERHATSGAKSDPGDAHVLAEIVRADRAHHRPVSGDSEQAEVVKTLARTHQSMIWTRQRQTNQLRSMLREFHPAALAAFGEDLAGRDALAVLPLASTPTAARTLSRSKIAAALRRAGRQRNIDTTAVRIVDALRSDQLGLSPMLADAYGASVRSIVAVITRRRAKTRAIFRCHRARHAHGRRPRMTTTPTLHLDAGDAAALAEMLAFISDWLTGPDRSQLAALFSRFMGTDAYDVTDLRADLARFTFLLGHDDGEQLFGEQP